MAGINPNNGSSPLGDDFVSITVTSEIVPVRIINTNALDVRVMNFPGVPPPIPGLKQSPYIPKLPGQKEEVIPKSRDVGGMVAAIAIGGILLKGLAEVKATLIDPLLGAAKGGFDSGVSRGAASGVLSKSFEVLGTAVGSQLLPVVIRLSSEAMALATNFETLKRNSVFGKAFDFLAGGKAENASGFITNTPERIFNSMNPLTLLLTRQSTLGDKYNPGQFFSRNAFGIDDKARTKIDEDSLKMQSLVIQSIRNSIGGQAGYHGISDIRNQAQLAAQQDPIERQIKELQIKALNKYLLENSQDNRGGSIAVAGA